MAVSQSRRVSSKRLKKKVGAPVRLACHVPGQLKHLVKCLGLAKVWHKRKQVRVLEDGHPGDKSSPAVTMILVHQIGSVKVGDVVRYTVTYTPSRDHILPSPEFLYLRIRNTSAIALRAAFVHGPYTLSVAAYPAGYNPHEKFVLARTHGIPEFEPMLKAGGTWGCHITVPEALRQTAGVGGGHFGGGGDSFAAKDADSQESVSWVIEVASQVVFSASAAVGYEVLVARDKKSVNIGSGLSLPLTTTSSSQAPEPGRISDHQHHRLGRKDAHPQTQQKGVFSGAIDLRVEDTASLWNTPRLSGWDNVWPGKAMKAEGSPELPTCPECTSNSPVDGAAGRSPNPSKKPKKVHLVILTHGLHSNLGADLLFLKESIDGAVKQAKADASARKARERSARKEKASKEPNGEGPSGIETPAPPEDHDDSDEEVIVRGFSGNVTRTERGIKYLGKRLAKFILATTYPDRPCLPVAKRASDTAPASLKGDCKSPTQVHKRSTIHHHPDSSKCLPEPDKAYRITSISFIGHSLGGLVQMYAVAYMQQHSPQFFDIIRPVNFIALATPFLGLSNENPLYVKFALDFGLVGRTGQDLGLTWRAPTIARSGWGAIVGNLGDKKAFGDSQPESKPLLRILPTGPAHTALQKFRSRTIYSNVVNDGIVPLRTSCLLFLDWQGLGRVDKARREAGLVETVVGFGWAEITGANVTSHRNGRWQAARDHDDSSDSPPEKMAPGDHDHSRDVPLPPTNATIEDDRATLHSFTGTSYQDQPNPGRPFAGFLSLFQKDNGGSGSTTPTSPKANKIYQRSQTLNFDTNSGQNTTSSGKDSTTFGSSENANTSSVTSSKTHVTSGHELSENASEQLSAPPKTTFFESAGDILNPKLPSVEYLIDPSKRPRTIFHDRVYHPADIPSPPLKKRPTSSLALQRRTITRTFNRSTPGNCSDRKAASSSRGDSPVQGHRREDTWKDSCDPADLPPSGSPSLPSEVPAVSADIVDSASIKVEEKIARAYHRGLSWRKVLVKLEPDAHNNIMVRRMFANAFGWPVVKHLVDAHFSDEAVARMRDEDEAGGKTVIGLFKRAGGDGREKVDARDAEEHKESNTVTRIGGKEDANRGQSVGSLDVESLGRTDSERREEEDAVGTLREAGSRASVDLASDTGRASSGDGVGDIKGKNPELRIAAGGYVPPRSSLSSPVTSMLSGSGIRPVIRDRMDSMTWSERDWADSGDESDDEGALAVMDSMLFGERRGGAGSGSRTPGCTAIAATADAEAEADGDGGRKRTAAAAPAVKDSRTEYERTEDEGSSEGRRESLAAPMKEEEEEVRRSTSPLEMLGLGNASWNWTEKIVGKGGVGGDKKHI